MILTNSIAAKVGVNAASAIACSKAFFRHFLIYPGVFPYNQPITSGVSLVKNGLGTLLLSGNSSYIGGTIINEGKIEFSGASTLNGVISGAGMLVKTGFNNLGIGGNNTYSGGTICSPSSATGTITITSTNAFGTGLFTSTGASQIITSSNITLANNFQINSGSIQFRVSVGTATLTINGNIGGSGSISKTSNGHLHLNGILSYTGSTSISAGTLRAFKTIGASTATATFASTSLSVSFNAPPPSGATDFRFFQGATTQNYSSVTLIGVPAGTTATYNSSQSTLSVTIP